MATLLEHPERGRSLVTGLVSKRTPPPALKIFMSETLRTQIQEKAGEPSKHYLEFANFAEASFRARARRQYRSITL